MHHRYLLIVALAFPLLANAQDSSRVRKSYAGIEFLNLINLRASGNGRYGFQPQAFLGIGAGKRFLLQMHAGYGRYQVKDSAVFVTIYDYRSEGFFGSISPSLRLTVEEPVLVSMGPVFGLASVYHRGYFELRKYPIPNRQLLEERFLARYFGVRFGVELVLTPWFSVNTEMNGHLLLDKGEKMPILYVPGAGDFLTAGNRRTITLRGSLVVRF